MHAVPALLETQRRFLAALYDDAATGPLASIVDGGLEPAARLRIYRNSCNEIQVGALRTAYPAVSALVGEAFFEQTARGYRQAHPSCCGNLQAFGQHFADYLAGLSAAHALPYLPDVARLEWLRQETALAAEPVDVRDGAIMHPCVRVFASPYPVLTIWRYALQPTGAGLELADAGEQVVLWREGEQVAMAVLDPASFACIETLARGGTLDDVYQAGRKQDPDFDFAACIESLVDRGLLAALPPSPSHQTLQSCQSFNS